jgi:CelD/BcsL family acetyltransferase involved in cellulose biosynthesis
MRVPTSITARTYTPRVSSCEPIPGFEAGRDEWDELAGRSGSVFATWEWATAWWRHFGEDGEQVLLRWADADGRPRAIFPLCRVRRGALRVLRFIGYGPGDMLGPFCAPAEREAAGAALGEALADGVAGSWHVLLAERLPGGALGAAIGGRVLQREASPELAIAGRSWEEFLAASSRNLREKLRRNTRKLERQHELSFRLSEDPARLEADLDTLIRLHRLRWGEGEGAFERRAVVAFHHDFAAAALRRGWLRLWTMEVDGEPAAAWYGFRFGGAESFYQSGRDPRFDRFSVGFLMLMQTVRAAFEDGLDRYAFLRGDEPYKDRLAESDPGLETRAVGHGPLGAATVLGGSLALRSPALRRRVTDAMR